MSWRYGVRAVAWAVALGAAYLYASSAGMGLSNAIAGGAVGGVLSWLLRDILKIVESRRQ